jgi:hypothetical protein
MAVDMNLSVLRPNSTIAWTRFDGTPETLPPEGRPVLAYTSSADTPDCPSPAILVLARDGQRGLVWQNSDFQDIQGDVMGEVEIDDCWGFLPENPLRAADEPQISGEDFSYGRIGV